MDTKQPDKQANETNKTKQALERPAAFKRLYIQKAHNQTSSQGRISRSCPLCLYVDSEYSARV